MARRKDRLDALADDLRSRHGVRVEVLPADLTDPEQRAGLAADLAQRGLSVDVLVNNAGIGTFGRIQGSDPDREVAVVRTDVEAVVDLSCRLIPGMVERGSGAMLNVASTAAYQPLPGQASYAAAKAFVLSYSRAVRAELQGTGVTVTALCPGPVHTEFGQAGGADFATGEAPLPGFMWLTADRVARAGVDGLDRGGAVVSPGLANKVTAMGGALLPRRVLLPLLARLHPALRGRGQGGDR